MTALAIDNGAVALVITGVLMIGTCETAKSEPDIPVTSDDEADSNAPVGPIAGLAPPLDAAAAAAAARLRLLPAAEDAAAPDMTGAGTATAIVNGPPNTIGENARGIAAI